MTSSSKKVTSHRLLASAGALSVVAGSLVSVPAAFACSPSEHQGGEQQQGGQASNQREVVTENASQKSGGNEHHSEYSSKSHKLWTTYSSYHSYQKGTIARVNVDNQQVEASTKLPGAEQDAGAYSISVDDANGTVWVVNTRLNIVTVYEQSSMKLLWSSQGSVQESQGHFAAGQAHEIKVDSASGKAFISGYGYITVIDIHTHTVLKTINLKSETGHHEVFGNMDCSNGNLNLKGQSSGTSIVVNINNLNIITGGSTGDDSQQKPKGNGDSNQTPKDKGDNSQTPKGNGDDSQQKPKGNGDSNQTPKDKGDNSQTPKGNGDDSQQKPGDNGNKGGSTGDGKDLDNRQPGGNGDSNQTPKDKGDNSQTPKGNGDDSQQKPGDNGNKGGNDNAQKPGDNDNKKQDLSRPGIYEAGNNEYVRVYEDGAKVYFAKSWEHNQSLTFRGEGFKTKDGQSGSVIAVKLNGGQIAPKEAPTFEGKQGNSAGVWMYIQADANGNFTATIPMPTTENSNITQAIKNGDKVSITLLTGSMKQGDTIRGGEAASYTFKVANASDNAGNNGGNTGNAGNNNGGNSGVGSPNTGGNNGDNADDNNVDFVSVDAGPAFNVNAADSSEFVNDNTSEGEHHVNVNAEEAGFEVAAQSNQGNQNNNAGAQSFGITIDENSGEVVAAGAQNQDSGATANANGSGDKVVTTNATTKTGTTRAATTSGAGAQNSGATKAASAKSGTTFTGGTNGSGFTVTANQADRGAASGGTTSGNSRGFGANTTPVAAGQQQGGPATAATTRSSSRTLANTGAPNGMWAALGAGSLAVAAGSVMVARRKKS